MVNILTMEASIAEVKKRLCELVDRVQEGETVTITRHGRPAAKIMGIPSSRKSPRLRTPDDPAIYKGVNLEEPILDEIE